MCHPLSVLLLSVHTTVSKWSTVHTALLFYADSDCLQFSGTLNLLLVQPFSAYCGYVLYTVCDLIDLDCLDCL